MDCLPTGCGHNGPDFGTARGPARVIAWLLQHKRGGNADGRGSPISRPRLHWQAMTAASGPAPADPDAGQPGWNTTLYAVWAGQLLALIGFSSRAPFLPFFLADLGVADVDGQLLWSGAITAAGAAVMALTAPLWGMIADRYGRKPMLMRGLFGGAVTVALMGFAAAPWQLVALRMLEGALTGTVAAATALVATSAPRHRLGYALGMVQTAVFAGAAAGPLLGGFAFDRIGARGTFELSAAMLFAGGIVVTLLARERFTPVARQPLDDAGRWKRMRTSNAFLFTGAMLTLLAAIFAIRMISMSMQPILPLFVEQLAPDNPDVATLAGFILGSAGLTSALAAAYLGRLGDRAGHRRVLAISLVAAGLVYLPMAVVRDPWQLAVLQALMGVAAGGLIPSANALIAHLTPVERRGAIFGLTAALGGLGGFVGPLLGASLATSLGFRATFVAAGALLLVVAGMVVWSRGVAESRSRKEAGEPARGLAVSRRS
jgi:MFS transporter, DHA1 family, multidrug resistance protein